MVAENPQQCQVVPLNDTPDFSRHVYQADQTAPEVMGIESVPIQQMKAIGESTGTRPYDLIFFSQLLQRFEILDETDFSAISLLTQLNSLLPGNPFLLRLLGDAEKVPNRSRLAYRRALEFDPHDQASFLKLIHYYHNSPYATRGYELIRDWEKKNELPAEAKILQARMLNKDSLPEAAYSLLLSADGENETARTAAVSDCQSLAFR